MIIRVKYCQFLKYLWLIEQQQREIAISLTNSLKGYDYAAEIGAFGLKSSVRCGNTDRNYSKGCGQDSAKFALAKYITYIRGGQFQKGEKKFNENWKTQSGL